MSKKPKTEPTMDDFRAMETDHLRKQAKELKESRDAAIKYLAMINKVLKERGEGDDDLAAFEIIN